MNRYLEEYKKRLKARFALYCDFVGEQFEGEIDNEVLFQRMLDGARAYGKKEAVENFHLRMKILDEVIGEKMKRGTADSQDVVDGMRNIMKDRKKEMLDPLSTDQN